MKNGQLIPELEINLLNYSWQDTFVKHTTILLARSFTSQIHWLKSTLIFAT